VFSLDSLFGRFSEKTTLFHCLCVARNSSLGDVSERERGPHTWRENEKKKKKKKKISKKELMGENGNSVFSFKACWSHF
jgi:hypothetical protein